MKRLVVALTLALLILAVSGVANAEPRDFASGSGKFNFGIGFGQVNFTGHGTPADANGHIRFDIEGTAFEGLEAKVDCVAVNGNRAALSGTLKEPPAKLPYITRVLLYVEDNGQPQDETDRAYGLLTEGPPIDCALFLNPNPNFAENIEQGNVIVKDNTP